MADVLDDVAAALRNALTGGHAHQPIISAAPGGGPEADRENNRVGRGGRIGAHSTRGHDALGYGGHGDPVYLDEDVSTEVQQLVRDHITSAQHRALREPRPAGRIRMQKPFSPETHTDNGWQFATGPFSLFDGTLVAPGAGNSLQQIPIALPTSAVSPVVLLDRYPGAMYMCIYVRSFAFMPTGSTMTGVQEVFFTDFGGAVAGLGIYNPANVGSAIFQNIGALCNSPLTDPGNAQIGTINVNNIGIAGTPVSVRWQLTVCYVAMYADPWFNEQVVVPPLPSEVARFYPSAGAQGG